MAVDTQTALANAGVPFSFTWRGRKFNVSFRIQKYKAAMERWAKDGAVKELRALKSVLPEDEYNVRMDRLIDRFQNGEFAFDGERMAALRETRDGNVAHIRGLVDPEWNILSDEEFLELFLEHGEEITVYMRTCDAKIDDIKRGLGWNEEKDPDGETLDPKVLIPALKKAGWWE